MEQLTKSEHNQFLGPWSPDGKTLAFVEDGPNHNHDILLLDVGNLRGTPYLNSPYWEAYPEISPDGRWMAYQSTESGRYEVYVQTFPVVGNKKQISNNGGTEPLWSHDGKQLFYRRGPDWVGAEARNEVWVVDVQTGSDLSPSKPRLLFRQPEGQLGYGGSDPIRAWDRSPDGKRFLMVQLEERKPQPLTEMVLVQNWFEEVRRLVPPGRNR